MTNMDYAPQSFARDRGPKPHSTLVRWLLWPVQECRFLKTVYGGGNVYGR